MLTVAGPQLFHVWYVCVVGGRLALTGIWIAVAVGGWGVDVSVALTIGVALAISVGVLDTVGAGCSAGESVGLMVDRGVGEFRMRPPPAFTSPTCVLVTNVTPRNLGGVGVAEGARNDVTTIAGVGRTSGCGR